MKKKENHINRLLLEKKIKRQLKSHYVYLKNLSRLVAGSFSHRKRKRYICDICLNFFFNENNLKEHEKMCQNISDCKVKLPVEGKDIIYFKNFNYKERLPFKIYADCECLLKPVLENQEDEGLANTLSFQKHEIFSIGYYLKCSF